MKIKRDAYLLVGGSLVCGAVIVAGIAFGDMKVALAVRHMRQLTPFFREVTREIPDLLLQLVCLATAVMWGAYHYLVHSKGGSARTQFLKLAATSVPLAYMVKAVLQLVLGRVQTRVWLQNGAPAHIGWFTGLESNGGFPSGHMTVFAAFFTAVWLHYPVYRPVAAMALSLLAAALILTNYHFLSDVVAGLYGGVMITLIARHFLEHGAVSGIGSK